MIARTLSARAGVGNGGTAAGRDRVKRDVVPETDSATVRLVQELDEVPARPEPPLDAVVVGDVVSVVAVRRGLRRREPDRIDAEALEMVEARAEAGEVADSVAVRVHERLDGGAVDERVSEPLFPGHGEPRSPLAAIRNAGRL